MRIRIGLIIIAGFLLFGSRSFAQDPDFHIYLCFGQSNMEGFPGIEDQDKTGVNERFQVLAAVDFPDLNREKGNWYTATPPLCRPGNGIGPASHSRSCCSPFLHPGLSRASVCRNVER